MRDEQLNTISINSETDLYSLLRTADGTYVIDGSVCPSEPDKRFYFQLQDGVIKRAEIREDEDYSETDYRLHIDIIDEQELSQELEKFPVIQITHRENTPFSDDIQEQYREYKSSDDETGLVIEEI